MDASSRHGWSRDSSRAALNGPRGVGGTGDLKEAGVLLTAVVLMVMLWSSPGAT
ncbi:MAG: hypothetical protein ACRDYA_06755 [Egibacteraceae bacterium]